MHIKKNTVFKSNLSCTGWTYSLRNLLRSALIGCSPFSIANLSASVGSGSGISNLRMKLKREIYSYKNEKDAKCSRKNTLTKQSFLYHSKESASTM
jgi:hypothetical protein